jgi:hypothetical protein
MGGGSAADAPTGAVATAGGAERAASLFLSVMCSISFALNGRLNRTIRDRVCETRSAHTKKKTLNQKQDEGDWEGQGQTWITRMDFLIFKYLRRSVVMRYQVCTADHSKKGRPVMTLVIVRPPHSVPES